MTVADHWSPEARLNRIRVAQRTYAAPDEPLTLALAWEAVRLGPPELLDSARINDLAADVEARADTFPVESDATTRALHAVSMCLLTTGQLDRARELATTRRRSLEHGLPWASRSLRRDNS